MPTLSDEPALSFWLGYAEREGALVEDHGDHALVLLTGPLREQSELPEEVTVTSHPDIAREDGTVLLIAGHPAVERAAGSRLAAGDTGSAYLPWPASRPPSRSVLESRSREQVPIEHGRIDAASEPIAAYLPLVRWERWSAMPSHRCALSTGFTETPCHSARSGYPRALCRRADGFDLSHGAGSSRADDGKRVGASRSYRYAMVWSVQTGKPVVGEVMPGATSARASPRSRRRGRARLALGRGRARPTVELDPVASTLWSTELRQSGPLFAVRCLATWWRVQDKADPSSRARRSQPQSQSRPAEQPACAARAATATTQDTNLTLIKAVEHELTAELRLDRARGS